MKNITKYLFASLASMLLLSSCNSWLTTEPPGKIVEGEFWKTEADVEAMVGTCYRAMINTDVTNRMLVYGELRGDNVTNSNPSTTSELGRIEDVNILPTNSYTSWAGFYTVINYCNVVLKWAPTVQDANFTASELRAREAEVLTIRALCYFYLVRTFKEVPLILVPSSSDAQNYQVKQSSEAAILAQIESDLLRAEKGAVVSYTNSRHNKGRITKNAVWAILADVYLWKNQYAKCVQYCDTLIKQKQYKLLTAEENPFTKIFSLKNSSESIFELQFESSNNYANATVNNFFGTVTNARGTFSCSEFIANTETNGVFTVLPAITDVRRKDNIAAKDAVAGWGIFKYAGFSRYENSEGVSTYTYRDAMNYPNIIMYRISDILLMKAEAVTQMINGQDAAADENKGRLAISLVNKTFMRANPTLVPADSLAYENYSDKTKLEELVLLERQRELMFEGKRWYDLMRVARRDGNNTRLINYVMRKYKLNASMISSKLKDPNALYWPIADSELKANRNLDQNPYYLNNVSTQQ